MEALLLLIVLIVLLHIDFTLTRMAKRERDEKTFGVRKG